MTDKKNSKYKKILVNSVDGNVSFESLSNNIRPIANGANTAEHVI
jgi:hypothetical protein